MVWMVLYESALQVDDKSLSETELIIENGLIRLVLQKSAFIKKSLVIFWLE